MSKYDLLKKVRTKLMNDSTITAAVGTNVRVTELPEPKVSKQITIRKEYGRSEAVLNACNPTLFVTVWVLQKENTEPYSICASIVDRVIDLLNRKGNSFNESTLEVNQIKKTDASIRYDDSQEYWVGSIIFDVVTNE